MSICSILFLPLVKKGPKPKFHAVKSRNRIIATLLISILRVLFAPCRTFIHSKSRKALSLTIITVSGPGIVFCASCYQHANQSGNFRLGLSQCSQSAMMYKWVWGASSYLSTTTLSGQRLLYSFRNASSVSLSLNSIHAC
jgi:hypothetical protein